MERRGLILRFQHHVHHLHDRSPVCFRDNLTNRRINVREHAFGAVRVCHQLVFFGRLATLLQRPIRRGDDRSSHNSPRESLALFRSKSGLCAQRLFCCWIAFIGNVLVEKHHQNRWWSVDVLLFFFVFDTKHVLRFAIDGGATTRRRRERRIANDDDGMERDTQILSDLPLRALWM